MLRCPSDDKVKNGIDSCTYLFSVGDQIYTLIYDQTPRGVFGYRRTFSFADITDGTSNTAMMSERISHEGNPCRGGSAPGTVGAGQVEHVQGTAHIGGLQNNPQICYTTSDGRYFVAGTQCHSWSGYKWSYGWPSVQAFNTVLPPNAPSCREGGSWTSADHTLIPPTSRHPGGVNLLLSDGSVRFVSETIDTGDLTVGQPNEGMSRYGVWGAIGSKAGKETVDMP
jgi:prepilin-type processing-associated H-X9-DG protein